MGNRTFFIIFFLGLHFNVFGQESEHSNKKDAFSKSSFYSFFEVDKSKISCLKIKRNNKNGFIGVSGIYNENIIFTGNYRDGKKSPGATKASFTLIKPFSYKDRSKDIFDERAAIEKTTIQFIKLFYPKRWNLGNLPKDEKMKDEIQYLERLSKYTVILKDSHYRNNTIESSVEKIDNGIKFVISIY